MRVIKYLIDFIALVFICSFVYLFILWTFFWESKPQHDIAIFRIAFWILGIWMVAVTFIGIVKTIEYFRSFILRKIHKV